MLVMCWFIPSVKGKNPAEIHPISCAERRGICLPWRESPPAVTSVSTATDRSFSSFQHNTFLLKFRKTFLFVIMIVGITITFVPHVKHEGDRASAPLHAESLELVVRYRPTTQRDRRACLSERTSQVFYLFFVFLSPDEREGASFYPAIPPVSS